jgi:hypothetical protein
MHEVLNNSAAQRNLEHLMSPKEKRRSRTVVRWLLGNDIARKAVAERLLLSDKPASAKLLDATSLARWTRLSRRLQILGAIGQLGLELELESDEVFELLDGCRLFGKEFQSHAVILIRNKQREDEMARRSAAATVSVDPAQAMRMLAG